MVNQNLDDHDLSIVSSNILDHIMLNVQRPSIIIVIYGVTDDGSKFRPSSWAEMLIEGVGLTRFGEDHRIRYAEHIKPALINGNTGIIMNYILKYEKPVAFSEILRFAKDNKLLIRNYFDRRSPGSLV